MTSRTPEGKHTKRFIVLKKEAEIDSKFERSYSISEAFATRELALAAIAARGTQRTGVTYKVRQK